VFVLLGAVWSLAAGVLAAQPLPPAAPSASPAGDPLPPPAIPEQTGAPVIPPPAPEPAIPGVAIPPPDQEPAVPGVAIPPVPAGPPPPAAGSPVPEGESGPVLVPPRLLEFVHADYPPAAQQAGLTAAVKLSLQVDATGAVTTVELLEPAGHGFDEAALDAARRFRFAPATSDGVPVGVTIRFTYRFTLEQQARPVPPPVASPPPATEKVPATAPDGSSPPARPTLLGRVLRRGDREPLAGIGVRASAAGLTVESDAQGSFALPLPPGSWELELIHPNFLPAKSTEEVRAGELLEVTYYLEARSRSPYHSVVRAEKLKKTVTRTTLDEVELVTVPGTFGEPFRVVQTLPGVARTPYGLGFLVVRGSLPFDTGAFIDGFEVPLLYHFLAGPAIFQAELVSAIDFYPGNFPVGYGRKQGGIVATRTKDEQPGDEVHGLASIDLLDLEALVRIPCGEESQITAAVRRSHFDLFVPLFTDESVSPRYWDYQLIGTTRLPAGWRGKATIFGSYDALDYERAPESEDDPGTSNESTTGVQFHRLHLAATRPFRGEGKLELSAMLGFDRILSTFNENLVEAVNYTGVMRAEANLPLLPERLTLSGGAELGGLYLDTTLDVPGMGHWTDYPAPRRGRDAALPRTRFGLGAGGYTGVVFGQLEWRAGPLLLIPGLRAELVQFEEFFDVSLDPRLIARLALTEEIALKGGVGLFRQLPYSEALDSTFGNPAELEMPYAVQYSLGTELKPLEFFDIDASLFYNNYRAQIIQDQATESGGTVSVGAPYTNGGEGRAYGLELLLRHRPHGPFFGWIAYTLSRAERRVDDGSWTLFPFDQTHILSALGSLQLGKSWTVGLKFQLVTGNPRTAVIGGAYDSDTNRYVAILGAPLAERNPTFHQLDLRVDKGFTFDRWTLTAYLDLLNVYNHANTEFIRYSYDFSESEVVPGIPILPSIGVKGEF